MTYLTRQQLADLRGCDPATVSRRKLPKVAGKLYDLADPEVREFVLEPWLREALRRELSTVERSVDEMNMAALEEEKLRADIAYKREQTEKVRILKERDKKNLVPSELVAIYLGHFAAGIRTNLLTIGNSVARGDTALRDKVEAEVKRRIERTLENAAASLRTEGKKIAGAIGEEA